MGIALSPWRCREGGVEWELPHFLVHDQVIVSLSSFNFRFLKMTPLVWQNLMFLCPISFEVFCLFLCV